MNNFSELRQLARDKRDAAIAAIKSEYRKELAEINKLEKSLTKKPGLKGRPKPKIPLWTRIMDVVPTDANFTVDDVLRLLDLPASDKSLIRTTFDRLMQKHLIKRLRRGRKNNPATFAVTEFGPPTNPLNDMSQVEAAETVLRELAKPLQLVELAVEMMERGYEPVGDPLTFKKSLGAAMNKSNRFKRIGDQYECCGSL